MNKWLLRLRITAQTVVLTVKVFACSSVFLGMLSDHLISYVSSRLIQEFSLADENMPSLCHSTRERVTVLSRAAIYRPISICSCLGKVMEKLVHSQFFAYLKTNDLLLPEQHGFMPRRSTLSNLLSCDAVSTDLVAGGHCYDITSFDFLKTFDNAPHSHVVRELAALGTGGKTLGWFASFLSNRTQQVKVANSFSITCDVISGTIQGSMLGPVLYTVLNNSLLRTIKKNPEMGFANVFKMIADVTVNSKAEIQLEIDSTAKWAKDHNKPLSINKSIVMHSGKRQPYHEYTLGQVVIKNVDSTMELGILKTADASYSNHCQAIAAKASRTAGAIRHAFRS